MQCASSTTKRWSSPSLLAFSNLEMRVLLFTIRSGVTYRSLRSDCALTRLSCTRFTSSLSVCWHRSTARTPTPSSCDTCGVHVGQMIHIEVLAQLVQSIQRDSTWSCIREIKGETTSVNPFCASAGSMYTKDLPPPVGISTSVS